jgi:hypothetical protein
MLEPPGVLLLPQESAKTPTPIRIDDLMRDTFLLINDSFQEVVRLGRPPRRSTDLT